MPRTFAAALLVTAGLAVAAVVAHLAGANAAAECGIDSTGCLELAKSLSLRAGLMSGAMTVIVLLMSAGLRRMVALDEGLGQYGSPRDEEADR